MIESKAVRTLLNEINEPLMQRSVHDYQGYVEDIISKIKECEINNEIKRELLWILRKTIDLFSDNYQWDIDQHIVNTLKKNSQINTLNKNLLTSYQLDKDLWERLGSKYKIKQLPEGIAYRGGIARHIARVVLDLEINQNDIQYADTDLFVEEWKFDCTKVSEQFQAGTDWIRIVPSLEIDTLIDLLSNVDCAMTQIAVTKQKLYISDIAIEELSTWIIKPNQKGSNIYGRLSYNIDGEDIFSNMTLYRLFRFLIYQKARGFIIPAHNINPDNLKLLNINSYLKVLLQKIIQEESEEKQIRLFANMEELLFKIGYISWDTDIFSYFSKRKRKINIWKGNTREITLQEEWNWLLSKYIKELKDDILQITHTLDGYDISNKELITVRLSYQDISDEFREKYRKFITKIKL